jgi:hypothetical protein
MAEFSHPRHLTGDAHRLAIARNLARIYTQVLEEPLPPDLADLLEALESREKSQRT